MWRKLRKLSVSVKRKYVYALMFVCIVVSVCAIFMSSWMIDTASDGLTYSDVEMIPHRHVGLVLGCSKQLSDGRANLFFRNRINAAVLLLKAGKIDVIIVSGDNSQQSYDEPTDMKNELIRAGIDSKVIYCDYAGFRTLDSVVRAKAIFNATSITVISQAFHNKRAIFIAQAHYLNAIGFNAADVDSFNSFRTDCRELLAKVKTVIDIYILGTEPTFYGEAVPINPSQLLDE